MTSVLRALTDIAPTEHSLGDDVREIFRQEMQLLGDDLLKAAKEAARAMERAAASLKDANLALAEQVIDADRRIDALETNINEMAISLLARQAPVAGDLRTVVSALRMSATIERMGDLARHVAYVARGRFPDLAVEGEVNQVLSDMADHATHVGQMMVELIETENMDIAEKIEQDDSILDDLHQRSIELVLDDSQNLTRQQLVDTILLGRYLERYGDHGVSIARRISFLVTGIYTDHDVTISEARAGLETIAELGEFGSE